MPRPPTLLRATALAGAVALAGHAAACGGAKPPRGTGDRPLEPPPALQGRTVMVLPAQGVRGVRGSPDAEIAFALRERGDRVDWVFPDELRRALARAPGVRVRMDALPVGDFRSREVKRIGDPLYGEIRRLGGLSDASVALVPIDVGRRATAEGEPPALEIAAALLEVRGGRVLWFGVVDAAVDGGSGAPPLARAADALARALLPGREP